jgi:hypothetical protein
MDHLQFKSDQTAAAYVADELDAEHREDFELHMMSCPDCVDDVEGWRAVKNRLPMETIPRQASHPEASPRDPVLGEQNPTGPVAHAARAEGSTDASSLPRAPSSTPARQPAAAASARRDTSSNAAAPARAAGDRRRLASAVAASLLAGTVGGWYMRSAHGPSLDTEQIGFYSLPPLARGPADCMSLALHPGVSLLVLRIPGAVPDQQIVPVDSEGRDLAPASYSVEVQGDGSWLVRLPAATVRQQGIRFEARSPDGTVEPRGCVISAAQQ